MTFSKTALHAQHLALGAKMIEFGGWEMPVWYEGILAEHRAVRTTVGLFDVSHMGEIEVSGADALLFLQRLLTNDLAKLKVGQVQYSFLCNPAGGVIDDLLVYKLAAERYGLVVNAGNRLKDWKWLKTQVKDEQVTLVDQTAEIGLLALQGPRAAELLSEFAAVSLLDLKPFHFCKTQVGGFAVLVSRTGYTGEDGFELYVEMAALPQLWAKLLQGGQKIGLRPAGLGARDTLRFEAGLPLYGQELNEEITPLQADLEFFVAWSKTDFIGKEALLVQKKVGLKRKLVGFEMLERGIPRSGYPLEKEGREIGVVTSGNYAPTLKANLGLGYVDSEHAFLGNEIVVKVRGRELKARLIKKPFYSRRR